MASGRFRSIMEVTRFLEAETGAPRNQHGNTRQTCFTELLRRSLYAGLITIPKWGNENHPGKHAPPIGYRTFSRAQEVLDGKQPAPARKDLNEDSPLRGFVNCGCCERPLTAAWSKSRNGTLHPYYLGHSKGCEMRGKSLRRADGEGAFEDVLKDLRRRQSPMDVATAMFKDAWEMHRQSGTAASESIRASLTAITSKIDKLMDGLVDAKGDDKISAYEAKLRKLQHEERPGG